MSRKASDGDELDRSLPKSGKNLLRARTMDLYHVIKKHWNYKEFLTAQVQVTAILIIARLSNTWEPSYPRNDNHNMTLFWSMQAILFLVAICTLQRSESDRIQLLSRAQTEEWKGWMQFAFIMVRCLLLLLCLVSLPSRYIFSLANPSPFPFFASPSVPLLPSLFGLQCDSSLCE